MSHKNNKRVSIRLDKNRQIMSRDIFPIQQTSEQIFHNKCYDFLDKLEQNQQDIFRRDYEYYYIRNDGFCYIGSKEEIEQIIGSKYNEIIEIVIKYKNSYKNKSETTTFIPCSYIRTIDKIVFYPNNLNRKIFQDNKIYINLFNHNKYLLKKFDKPIQDIEQKEESLISKVLSIATTLNSTYIKILLSRFFVNFEREAFILTLIGNQEFTENIIFTKIISEIFGHDYCLILSEEVLKNQSLDDILKNKLFFYINHIPEDKELLKKLETIIQSAFLQEFITSDRKKMRVMARIIISLDSTHSFINKLERSSKIFFINSTESILGKLNMSKNEYLLFSFYIKGALDSFSDELNYFGRKTYNIEDFKVNNKDFIDEIEKISPKEIVSNQEVLLNINNLEKFILVNEKIHTYITGQSGSGKTEFMKTLFLSIFDKNNCSAILLDSHGDCGLEIGKNIKDKDRLIFIDPTLDSKKKPTINIFDLKETSESIIMQTSRMIISIVKDINDDDKFSGAMSDVLENCIPILLRKGKSSFKELYRFMNDKKNKDLVELGKNSPNDIEKEYFEDKFSDSSLSATKDGVARRLKKFLNDELFSNLMNGESTINLEKEMNTKGKIIIFRIPKNKMLDTYKYYARFILGLIQIIALKRADLKENDRVHTHLFIDEFHNFITPSIEEILTESRKYKLFLTLAHQSISQISSSKLRDIILSNTNVKIIGKNSNKTLEVMNKTLNEKLEEVENLDMGEFYIKSGISPSIKVKNSDEFIGDKNSISEEEWNESKEYQLKHYYRDIKVMNEAEEVDKKIDECIEAIVSKNQSYFKKIKETDEILYEELIYNFDDENGFIAQPLLSKYFNIINDNNFPDNKIFLQKLKEKDTLFNQDVDKNKTYKSKKRYLLE